MGGSERVLLTICGELKRRGHDVVVYTRRISPKPEYPVPAGIERRVFSTPGHVRRLFRGIPSHGFMRRYRTNRALLLSQDPDVLLAFGVQAAVRVLFYTFGCKTPVVVSERNNPSAKSLALGIRVLRRLLYKRAASLVLVSNDMVQYFRYLPSERVQVIHNAAPDLECTADSRDGGNGPLRLVSMGRMVPQKGFDLLLQAFAQLRLTVSDVHLTIIGDGPERDRLRHLVSRLDLDDAVVFAGIVGQPQDILCKSDVFVLSSRFEGFPNVLLEALACKLPVVSFDCPTGPSEIVIPGINGILVEAENVKQLSAVLREVCTDRSLQGKLAAGARSSLRRFEYATIMRLWERALLNASGQGSRVS